MKHKRYSFIDDPWGWLDADDDNEPLQSNVTVKDKTQWKEIVGTAQSPRGRCSHSLTSIGNSCLLLFGGGYATESDPQFHHLNDLWLFNGITAKWNPLETAGELIPPARRGHVAEYYPEQDLLMVFGGMSNEDELLNDLWILDLMTLKWEQLGPKTNQTLWPSGCRGSISFLHNGTFYLLGGETKRDRDQGREGPTLLEIFAFGSMSDSPKEDWKWYKCSITECDVEGCESLVQSELLKSMPACNILYASGAFLRSDEELIPTLFVFGGILGGNGIYPFLQSFSLKTDGTFRHVYLLREGSSNEVYPNFRYFHGCCAIGSSDFVIAGGIGPDGNTPDTFVYNTKRKVWTLLSSPAPHGPAPRNGLTLAPLDGTQVILFGGGEYQSAYFRDTHVLKLSCEDHSKHVTSSNNHQHDVPQPHLLQDVTATNLVISRSDGPPIVKVAHVQTLSANSEYFQRMLEGPFLESGMKEIRLPELDPSAASTCLDYMHQGIIDVEHMLNHLDQLDSVFCLADMWGMRPFLRLLEDIFYTALLKGKMDDLELFEYAKTRHAKRLAMKCLKAFKARIGLNLPPDYERNLDPALIQEVKEYVEVSLL